MWKCKGAIYWHSGQLSTHRCTFPMNSLKSNWTNITLESIELLVSTCSLYVRIIQFSKQKNRINYNYDMFGAIALFYQTIACDNVLLIRHHLNSIWHQVENLYVIRGLTNLFVNNHLMLNHTIWSRPFYSIFEVYNPIVENWYLCRRCLKEQLI